MAPLRGNTGANRGEPALPTVAVPAPAPVQYRPLLGLYARAGLGGGVLSLQWRAGELAFLIPEIPSWRLTLEPTSDTDVFVAGPGSDLAGENVIFRRRNDGHVTSVLLVQATYLRQDHDSRTGRSDQPLCAAHYRSGLAHIRQGGHSWSGAAVTLRCGRDTAARMRDLPSADSTWHGQRPGADHGSTFRLRVF